MPPAPTPKPRRISYIVPPPDGPPKRLRLPPLDTPRNGRTAPLLFPADVADASTPSLVASSYFTNAPSKTPQHRLGVTALALDTSTTLSGRPTPEGILYSGGRDGMIIAWEQGTPMRIRNHRYPDLHTTGHHWESMTGWDDEDSDEDEEDWVDPSNTMLNVPFEERWEPDYEGIHEHGPGTFRQCVQSHADWINDIVLCNYNRTLVSASNDGTIKAWNPHGTQASEMAPAVIGEHTDYVRCVAYSRERNWIASGSFDRTIKLWDLHQPHPDPLMVLSVPDTVGSPKASVYGLATHPLGHLIAAGSPERVVRLWDARTGNKISKLVGHTDNIRALLLSEDGKYLLSGSSDRTIKLWSLTAQRCLHTFAYHTDSVWSLFSNHPNLEVFYSGDRSGLVCKVDVEGCGDLADGECIVVCKDVADPDDSRSTDGVSKIVAMDDLYVWTATGSSSIKRWLAPRKRADRTKDHSDLVTADLARAESPGVSSFLSHFNSSSSVPHRASRNDLSTDRSESSPPTTPFMRTHHPRFSIQSSVSGTGTLQPANAVNLHATPAYHGIPLQSLVKLAPPRDLYSSTNPLPRGRDADIVTLYSAASVRSVPALARTADANSRQPTPPVSALLSYTTESGTAVPSSTNAFSALGAQYVTAPDAANYDAYEERELAVDAIPLCATPNDCIQGSHGLVRSVILNNRIHALTVDTAGEVAVWDLVRMKCVGVYSSEDIAGCTSNAGSTVSGQTGNNAGNGVERSPREALETVRERIEGEAMCPSWATVDTKIGHLTVHLVESRCFDAEVYADEVVDEVESGGVVFPEDHKLNVGKWVLTNLFSGFVRAEVELMAQTNAGGTKDGVIADMLASEATTIISTPQVTSTGIVRGAAPTHISLAPTDGRRLHSASEFSTVMRTPGHHALGAPALTPAILPDIPMSGNTAPSSGNVTPSRSGARTPSHVTSKTTFLKDTALTPIPASPMSSHAFPTSTTGVTRTPSTVSREPTDYFSGKGRARSGSTAAAGDSQDEGVGAAAPMTPGSGFMGRLKNFGKSSKRPASGDATVTAPIVEDKDAANTSGKEGEGVTNSLRSQHLRALNAILTQPLTPPLSLEAPPVSLPSSVAVTISEESTDDMGGGTWTDVYNSVASQTEDDLEALEMAAPIWLLELLLLNRFIGGQVLAKVSFVVVAYESRGEAIADSSRLTAGRILRVRKVLQYVRDKLEPIDNARNLTSKPASALAVACDPKDARAQPPQAAASSGAPPVPEEAKLEDTYELLCNEMALPVTMTIGAVRHYVWRQGGELTMYYRRKPSPAPATSINDATPAVSSQGNLHKEL